MDSTKRGQETDLLKLKGREEKQMFRANILIPDDKDFRGGRRH